jgi:hypothetical protein
MAKTLENDRIQDLRIAITAAEMPRELLARGVLVFGFGAILHFTQPRLYLFHNYIFYSTSMLVY